ncbi:MAG TPA: rod shape-determining protein RodA [Acidimicrobiales bacterium]|nr:rod shape-determining protein RodA [Acidimicrobiales bacterium]
MAGFPGSPGRRANPAAPWHHVDTTLMASVVAIASLGMLMVYSATHKKLQDAGIDSATYLKRQAVFVLLGVGVMILVASIDYRVYRDFAPVIYVGGMTLLLFVLTPLGSTVRGTQAWYQVGPFQLQPSEIAKVVVIVCGSTYAALHRGELDGRRVAVLMAIIGGPMAIVYLQPDLGTALVFVAILMGLLLVAGAKPRHLGIVVLLGVFGVVTVFQLGVIKQYQLDRLGAFLDPAHDQKQSAYNLHQSTIAIGSGGIRGKGLFKGSQTNLSYVPEQRTDFIFTVVGEELGLLGSALLLVLFAIVVWRTWRAAALSKDLYGTLVCVGVLAMFVFQIFENVGMTMGIMPITGIPLPFVSYGGSATLASFAGIGLVLNVYMRRFS